VLITLLAVAAAPVVEVVYPEYAGSAALIAVAALTCLFSGLESTSLGVLSREMQVRRLALLNLGIQILSSATTIVWALVDPSPWALVSGAVLGGAVRAIVSHAWDADRFGWDPSAWRELFSFGKWVFVSTALTFFVTQADKFVFASLIPPELLGVYAIALQIAMVLPEISGRLVGGVLFPAYCRVVNANQPLVASFHRYRRPIVLVSGYGIALCCAGGTAGVDLLYTAEFADAGWILQYLAIGGWFGYALQGTHGSALLAVGRPKLVTYTSIAKLAGMLALIPVGYRLGGFAGAVGAYAATDVLRYATMVACSRAIGVRALADDLRWTAWFGATAAAGWFAQHLAEQAGVRPLVRCVVAGAVVTLAWAPLLVPAVREIKARLRR
jgi:O-antigen/teichoic acid export membrane protein